MNLSLTYDEEKQLNRKKKETAKTNLLNENGSIVFHHDKRSGKTYVYRVEHWWDSICEHSCSVRRSIGRVDSEDYRTGKFQNKKTFSDVKENLLATDGRGRKRKT
jgi:hypothetical protein